MRTEWLFRIALAALVAEAAIATPAMEAQAKSGTIRGNIMTTNPRRPIEGARITLVGTSHSATTDANGAFTFADLDPGQYVIRAAAIGYTTLSSPLLLRERETLDIEFEANAEAVNLPELTVAERANHGPAEWLRRKSEGRGRYITRQMIEDRRAASVPDALRMVPGVRVECRGGGPMCVARMIRSPRNCGPSYFLDGIPTDPAALWMTPVSDIEGVEVYSGPSETPPELEGVGSRCGAIALWTRPPPPRKPKEKKPKPEQAPADSTATPPASDQSALF